MKFHGVHGDALQTVARQIGVALFVLASAEVGFGTGDVSSVFVAAMYLAAAGLIVGGVLKLQTDAAKADSAFATAGAVIVAAGPVAAAIAGQKDAILMPDESESEGADFDETETDKPNLKPK